VQVDVSLSMQPRLCDCNGETGDNVCCLFLTHLFLCSVGLSRKLFLLLFHFVSI